ncbi:epoxide hydrolase N-terminal domain-containing protein [Amycolatopsis sp. EV170708-02-1]|nr:epoxide hydrolase N-terminal domain-containing protein [Amycolatopsis sp. EV170708-02-1]
MDAGRRPDEAPGVGRAQGIPPGYTQALARYWREGCDWRAEEVASMKAGRPLGSYATAVNRHC